MPPISVVVATTHAWPVIETTLEILHRQVQAVGGQVVVADGDGNGLPQGAAARYPNVVWLKHPGASVFDLRAHGIATAEGAVVATTEDHCIPAPDWCDRTIAAHRERPDSKAISGAVLNGSQETLVDWANFLLTFSTITPPLRNARKYRVPPPVNISYKQGVLSPRKQAQGFIEIESNRILYDAGDLKIDDRILVSHVQPFTLREACAAHFHNGRTATSFATAHLAYGLVEHVDRQLRRPLTIVRQTLRGARGKPVFAKALLCLPLITLLAICHTAGETLGILAGPGNSADRLS